MRRFVTLVAEKMEAIPADSQNSWHAFSQLVMHTKLSLRPATIASKWRQRIGGSHIL
jgi:hypothetical protein